MRKYIIVGLVEGSIISGGVIVQYVIEVNTFWLAVSIFTLCVLTLIGMCYSEIAGWVKGNNTNTVTMPDTKTWLWEKRALEFIQNHPAGGKHMMNMPIDDSLEDIKEIMHGKPSRRRHNSLMARTMLDNVVEKYPQVKKDDKYSVEILDWALNKRLIND